MSSNNLAVQLVRPGTGLEGLLSAVREPDHVSLSKLCDLVFRVAELGHNHLGMLAHLAATSALGKGPATMTTVKLTPAELRLLDIQKARGIPFPDNILAWREANAAALAALEPDADAQAGL